MKISRSGNTLSVSGIKELATVAASSLRSELNPFLPPDVRQIDMDLSETDFVDCGGLGALVALRNRAGLAGEHVTIRLLNPPLPLQRMVSLLHLDGQFRMEQRAPRLTANAESDSQALVA